MLIALIFHTLIYLPQVFALEYRDSLFVLLFAVAWGIANEVMGGQINLEFAPMRSSIERSSDLQRFTSQREKVRKILLLAFITSLTLFYYRHLSMKSRRIFMLEHESETREQERLASMQDKVKQLEGEMELQEKM